MKKILVAIPVYNEEKYVADVLTKVLQFTDDVLVIDDGSSDRTPTLLAQHHVEVIRHAENRGYGRSLQDAFRWAITHDYDWLITMDCDEQHEPAAIPRFVEAFESGDADILSGSRYLVTYENNDQAPTDRRDINATITRELNERLGLNLTDAFCGFKAYRVDSLRTLNLDVDGYDFPMQFWVQAVAKGLRTIELPVRLIYNDPARSFGGNLDEAQTRLLHYRDTLHLELQRCRHLLPIEATADVQPVSGSNGSCCHVS